MDENELQAQHHAPRLEAVIVSGADDDDDFDDIDGVLYDDDYCDDDDYGDAEAQVSCSKRNPEEDTLYYNKHMDEEDEAWVYRHLRSGIDSCEQRQNETNDESATAINNQRPSDAVLSCPSCFTIVCMDCQQHVKYKNQYRAMFVMNIEVHWESMYVYDEDLQKLITRPPTTSINAQEHQEQHHPLITKVEDESTQTNSDTVCSEDLYYSVHCKQCKSQVAALCMYDEVYHFFDCIAST